MMESTPTSLTVSSSDGLNLNYLKHCLTKYYRSWRNDHHGL